MQSQALEFESWQHKQKLKLSAVIQSPRTIYAFYYFKQNHIGFLKSIILKG